MKLERFWNGKFSGMFAALWYAATAACKRIARGTASLLQCSRLGRHGRKCRIGLGVTMEYPNNIVLGDKVIICDRVSMTTEASLGRCHLGNGVHIGREVELDFSGKIIIGDNSTVSEGVVIETHSHGHDPRANLERMELAIGRNVWIGMRSIILPQVGSIGENSIVGAGSVVTKPVLPNVIVAGNPAVIIKHLNQT